MQTPFRRKLTVAIGAGILALAGITGVVRHAVVHAAPAGPTTSQVAPGTQAGDATDQQDATGADTADKTTDTGAADTADKTTDTGAADAGSAGETADTSTEATGPETDANAPCSGTGATQTGNCDQQDSSG